jgi:acetyl esterase/lipase
MHKFLIDKSLRLALIVIGATVCSCISGAQTPNPGAYAMTPIPTPAQPDALPLYPGVAPGSEGATQVEQWEHVAQDTVVRNVTRPTLTPILPAKGKGNGAAIIVAPGGGFVVLSIANEGYDVAHWLADRGIAAFVLKYRVNPSPADEQEFADFGRHVLMPHPGGGPTVLPNSDLAVADGQEAVRMVRGHAAQWGVDPKRVGMVGFSAGAMTVLQVALKNAPDARPDFIAPIYGPMSTVDVPPNAPPMFVARAADDPLLGLSDFGLIDAWKKAGAPFELHVYEHGGHGFGASHHGTTSDLWLEEFYAWLKSRGTLEGK